MTWIYWILILAFNAVLALFKNHNFILVWFSPFTEFVWVAYPLFALLTLYHCLKSHYKSRKILNRIVVFLIVVFGFMVVIVGNFTILPWFVLFSTIGSIVLLYRKLIRYDLSLLLMVITSILYFYQYYPIFFNLIPDFSSANSIRILSYNFPRDFSSDRLEEIEFVINEYQPDIICLQEISHSDKAYFQENLIEDYPYQLYPKQRWQSYQAGIVLSRYAFTRADNIRVFNRYKDSSLSMNYVVVKQDSTRSFSLYNVHLISNGMSLRNAFKADGGISNIVEEERINYIKRLDEAKNVIANINFSDKNIILIGDFNDIIHSRVLNYFDDYFNNAWFLAGTQHHLTFGYKYIEFLYHYFYIPRRFAFSFVGIDHAFIRGNINVKSYRLLPDKYSDHVPILLEVEIIN